MAGQTYINSGGESWEGTEQWCGNPTQCRTDETWTRDWLYRADVVGRWMHLSDYEVGTGACGWLRNNWGGWLGVKMRKESKQKAGKPQESQRTETIKQTKKVSRLKDKLKEQNKIQKK